MGIIIILISISLVLAIGFLTAFLWSMKSGQFDDVHSPAVRILFETTTRRVPKREASVGAAEKRRDVKDIEVDRSRPK